MAKKSRNPEYEQLTAEEARWFADTQYGARACIEFLNNLRAKGISWHTSELRTLLESLNSDATHSFMTNLEIFLAEAVCHKNVLDCYWDGVDAHKRVREARVAELLAQEKDQRKALRAV